MKIDTNHFKKELEAELQKLEGELKTVGRKNPSNPNDWEATPPKMDIDTADDMEVAERIDGYEENTAILKQLEIRYNEIKKALTRIADGSYGICEVGNDEIEKERLAANPAATTCIKHMN